MKSYTVSLGALLLVLYSCSAFMIAQPVRTLGFQLAQTPTEPSDEPPSASSSEATTDEETPQEAPIKASEDESIEEEEKEDPEMVALKAEITELETTLKAARTKLAYTSDKADDYSKAGYARKVAEMESLRRNSQVRIVNRNLS